MNHHKHNNSSNNIGFAFILNLGFTIIEIVGGFLTNSISIMSDALHDLGDSLSLGLSWLLERVASKKRSKTFSYGYKRFSLLAALINGVILTTGSVFILMEAVKRIAEPETTNGYGMFVLAIAGIVVNGIAALRVKKGKTLNEKMVSWHLFEDVLGWVAVMVASVFIIMFDLYILDPLLSIFITIIILYNVIKNLKNTVAVFLQGTPASIDINQVTSELSAISKVKAIHDLHVWSLDGESNVMSVHVVTGKNILQKDTFDIKCKVRKVAHDLKIQHATIDIECEGEECGLENC